MGSSQWQSSKRQAAHFSYSTIWPYRDGNLMAAFDPIKSKITVNHPCLLQAIQASIIQREPSVLKKSWFDLLSLGFSSELSKIPVFWQTKTTAWKKKWRKLVPKNFSGFDIFWHTMAICHTSESRSSPPVFGSTKGRPCRFNRIHGQDSVLRHVFL